MTELSPRQIARITARDRRLAAVHEAGHFLIAREFGVEGDAWLIESGPAEVHSKAWIGQFRFRADQWARLSKIRRAMIGVAGAVAECCWHGEGIEEWELCDIFADPNIMSPTDWQHAGYAAGCLDSRGLKAAESVVELFRRGSGRLWPSLCWTSRMLVLEARGVSVLP